MGKFVISKTKYDEFQFVLKVGNGQNILSGSSWKTKTSCDNIISSIKINSKIEERFQKKYTNWKYHFVLKASNGVVIGESQIYDTEASRDYGIELVMKYAPDANVEYYDC